MKYLIVLLFSFSVFAESYEISHRGHVFTYSEEASGLTLKSKRLSFEIPVKGCSKGLIDQVKDSFASKLNFTTKATDNVVLVKSSKGTTAVPDGHPNGRYLALFPDHFAKSYLVYKEVCK